MTTNMAELTIVLLGLAGASLLDWPIPLLVVQMLAIDLLAEILPLTALTFDPGSRDLMTSPPRRRTEHILNRGVSLEILFLGALMGTLAFVNFYLFMGRTGAALTDTHELYARATTLSYVTIVFCQFVNILSRRYALDSLFSRNLWSNGKMLWSIAISIAMILLAVYVPFVGSFFSFAALTLTDWGFALAGVAVFLSAHEVMKAFRRSRRVASLAAA
jgi:Ca2+-transporting ATPase